MEDDLEAQLVQQLAEVQQLRAKKERREREVRQKAEREAKEKAAREAQERERQENEYWARYQEEQQWKHEVVAQRVAEAKLIQRQVQMLEVFGSRRNGDSDVSSPSPSPAYIRLIRKQAAWVSCSETERIVFINGIGNREKLGLSGRAFVVPVSPVGSLASGRTARRPVTGARSGRSHATFPGGSCVRRRRSGKAGPSLIPMMMRRASLFWNPSRLRC